MVEAWWEDPWYEKELIYLSEVHSLLKSIDAETPLLFITMKKIDVLLWHLLHSKLSKFLGHANGKNALEHTIIIRNVAQERAEGNDKHQLTMVA